MMKVKCIQKFNDVTMPEDKMRRSPGDIWETTEERGANLLNQGLVEIVQEKTTTVKEK